MTARACRRAGAAAVALGLLALAGAGSGSAPPTVRLGLPGVVNANASIAADGTRVVVAWAAHGESATDVYAAFSRDGGVSFDAPVRVNDLAGDARVSGEQAPRVALGPGVEVAWASRRGGASGVRLATAAPGGRAFAPATTVHAEGLTGARGWTSLAAGGDGALHLAWLDGRGDGVASPAAPPGPATSRKDARQDLYHAVRRPDGSCDEVRVATDVCFCCKTAVAAGPDGSVYVAWRHIYPPNVRDVAVARSSDGGRSFGPPVRVSEDGWAIDGCPDDGPALAVDARGRVHVVWPTPAPEGGGKGIFYSHSSDGGRSFAPRARVDEAPGGAAHPQLAAAGDRLFVVWDQGRGNENRQVRLREIREGAGGFAPRPGPSTVLSGERTAAYPAVAAVADGAVAVWTEESGSGAEIRVRRVGR